MNAAYFSFSTSRHCSQKLRPHASHFGVLSESQSRGMTHTMGVFIQKGRKEKAVAEGIKRAQLGIYLSKWDHVPISEPVAVTGEYGGKTQQHLPVCLPVKPEMDECLLTCKICGLGRPCALLLQKGVKDAGQAKGTNLNLSQGHQLYLKNTFKIHY